MEPLPPRGLQEMVSGTCQVPRPRLRQDLLLSCPFHTAHISAPTPSHTASGGSTLQPSLPPPLLLPSPDTPVLSISKETHSDTRHALSVSETPPDQTPRLAGACDSPSWAGQGHPAQSSGGGRLWPCHLGPPTPPPPPKARPPQILSQKTTETQGI